MRRLLLVLSLLLSAIALAGAGAATAATTDFDGGAYCAPGSVGGTGGWTPSNGTALEPHSVSFNVTATCTGAGDDAGFYTLTFTGTSEEDCAAGDGGGAFNGGGPEGAIGGAFTYYRIGIHLYISGNYVADNENHTLQFWLDTLPGENEVPCTYSYARFIGHGAVADSDVHVTVGQDPFCTFSGSTTSLTPIPVTGPNAGTWSFSGTATCGLSTYGLSGSGTYSNTQCGTGTANGTITYASRTRGVTITFSAFNGAMTFSDGGHGQVTLTPQTGGCVTAPVTSLTGNGWFTN